MRNKYAGLGAFLEAQRRAEVPMTFAEVERITQVPLPPSARRHRPWWSNNPHNSVMTRVWLDAGFKTERVDMAGEKLVFRRTAASHAGGSTPPTAQSGPTPPGDGSGEEDHVRHPFFGALKGLIRIPPDTDLTEPADPDWGRVYEE